MTGRMSDTVKTIFAVLGFARCVVVVGRILGQVSMSSDAAPMSDNPADSLRRELETAMREAMAAKFTHYASGWQQLMAGYFADKAFSAVFAALEAARADERERNAQVVEDAPAGEWVDYGDEEGKHFKLYCWRDYARLIRAGGV